MNTIQQLEWRYAAKKFDSRKILSKDKLHTLKQAFNLTATSFGLQTINLVVIESKDLRTSLVEHAYGQNQVLDASHLLILCVQENIKDHHISDHFDNIKKIRATSDEILDPYKKNLIDMMKTMSVEEQEQWSKNQAYIALGNLMTVCAIEEIDSCPMEGFVAEKFDEVLKLKDKGLKSVLLLPVGYRAEDDMFADFRKVRKPIEESVIELK